MAATQDMFSVCLSLPQSSHGFHEYLLYTEVVNSSLRCDSKPGIPFYFLLHTFLNRFVVAAFLTNFGLTTPRYGLIFQCHYSSMFYMDTLDLFLELSLKEMTSVEHKALGTAAVHLLGIQWTSGVCNSQNGSRLKCFKQF